MKIFSYTLISLGLITLVGCQSQAPIKTQVITPQPIPKTEDKIVEPESKVRVIPYPESGIVKKSQPLPPTYQAPRVILPESNQAPSTRIQLKDGRGIAAYSALMNDYRSALQQNNLVNAERSLIQAQRMAPQSADVYQELAHLANLRQQGANAEAMARKGLTYAQTNAQRKQLWQQILQSALLRSNAALAQQAQNNMSRY